MPVTTNTFHAAAALAAALLSSAAHAEGIDTEHIFGFMIGSDVGDVGEREFQSQTTGRLGKGSGHYRAGEQEFEFELVPARNFRIELGTSFAGYDIGGVTGFDDRRLLTWQGGSLDLRYRFLDRETAPFGMTLSVQNEASRVDDTSGASARQYGTAFTLAFDREIVPGLAVAALNLSYQPEWTRLAGSDDTERDATVGAAFAVMAQFRPGILLGGEARYFRRYDGFGLEALSGQALFIGPTAYFQLSERSRLTASWSTQAWGRESGTPGGLDLRNFEHHQARLVFGVNF
jgi:opacity protein-like surface antigen